MALNLIRPLWAYRGFMIGSVKQEYQSKHRNSLLGAVLTVINPLAMIIVYTVIFSQIMKANCRGWIQALPIASICVWGCSRGACLRKLSAVRKILFWEMQSSQEIEFPEVVPTRNRGS